MDVETLGLRSSYVFKQTHIPWAPDKGMIRSLLKDTIAPVIRELESGSLINGFHYIVHEQIDLRLSCCDWPQHEASIREILKAHFVSSDLEDYNDRVEMPPEKYGGEEGVVLCYNNLEFNSRLCLALAELMSETNDDVIQQRLADLCPHQWVHYLCNQFGYLPFDQAQFQLGDALCWLEDLRRRCPQHQHSLQELVEKHKEQLERFEADLSSGEAGAALKMQNKK